MATPTLFTHTDARANGAELPISNEPHVVGEDTPNYIMLHEVPKQETAPTPSSVVIPGYTETTGTPAAGQFRVFYGPFHASYVEFNAANNGASVTVSYKGRGSARLGRDINRIHTAIVTKEDDQTLSGVKTFQNVDTSGEVMRYLPDANSPLFVSIPMRDSYLATPFTFGGSTVANPVFSRSFNPDLNAAYPRWDENFEGRFLDAAAGQMEKHWNYWGLPGVGGVNPGVRATFRPWFMHMDLANHHFLCDQVVKSWNLSQIASIDAATGTPTFSNAMEVLLNPLSTNGSITFRRLVSIAMPAEGTGFQYLNVDGTKRGYMRVASTENGEPWDQFTIGMEEFNPATGNNVAFLRMGIQTSGLLVDNPGSGKSGAVLMSGGNTGDLGFKVKAGTDIIRVVTAGGANPDSAWFPFGVETLYSWRLGVGNTTPAATLGPLSKVFEIVDADGNSLGYVPVHSAFFT